MMIAFIGIVNTDIRKRSVFLMSHDYVHVVQVLNLCQDVHTANIIT